MGRCLVALESQTYTDFEVLVIDDCSSDDSYRQLLNYAKKTKMIMKIFHNQKNVGPGESRNFGISEATGEWLAFCDADDWYDIFFLEKMIQSVLMNHADIAVCNYAKQFHNGKNRKNNNLDGLTLNSSTKDWLLCKNESLCTILVKSQLFDNLFLPKIYNGEDIAIIPLLIQRAKKIVPVHDALYNYVMRVNSASNKPNSISMDNLYLAFMNIYEKSNPQFIEEIEFIGIRTLIYGGTLIGFKSRKDINSVRHFINNFQNIFPNWKKSKYIKKMELLKKIYIWFLSSKMFKINIMMAKFHKHLVDK